MKNICTLLVCLFQIVIVDGQNDTIPDHIKKWNYVRDQYDSLSMIKNKLKDGNYKLYYDKEKKNLALNFNVENGKINGLIREYDQYGDFYQIGTYYKDSIWTYYTSMDIIYPDSTFRIGNWLHYYRGLGNSRIENYKKIYNNDSLYFENWLYKNDTKWKESIYHQRKGLILEKYYYYNGQLESSYEVFPNNSIKQYFDTLGNLEKIEIHDKMDIKIRLTTGEERGFIRNPELKSEFLSDSEGHDYQTRYFYPNGNLKEFFDVKSQIKISYDEKGEVLIIEKRKKNGKWKRI